MHDLGTEFFRRLFVGRDAIATKGIVLSDTGDADPGFGDGDRIGNGILAGIAACSEYITVPVLTRNGIGHRRLHNKDLLKLLRHRQYRQSNTAAGRSDGQVHLVVAVKLGKQHFGSFGLELGILDVELYIAAIDLIGSLGEVFKPHFKTGNLRLAVDLVGAA